MDDDYVTRVEALRREKDAAFRSDPRSPIPQRERAVFRGLRYYPVDPAWRFRLPLVPRGTPAQVTMQASDGDVRHYAHVGHFEVPSPVGAFAIQAYESRGGHGLFIPFRDRTSGRQTYGAGRYLEVEESAPGGAYELDFNLAYNPFCAYDEAYACPFPPPENWLQVEIPAGERAYET